MISKNWIYSEYNDQSPEAKKLASACGISPFIAAVALNRGINSADKIVEFLLKPESMLHSPFCFKDMEKAVSIIKNAISGQKRICIYGDYDVDGITSTSLLLRYFASCGITADYYIPHRIEEGYGINEDAIRTIANRGCDLLITVDTGITACAQVELARRLGIETVVTDHHECVGDIPDCPVINPHVPGCGYPFTALAGVGVAFKLVCALEDGDTQQVLDKYSDLVMLGTVADVMDMLGENRCIVKNGLQKLQTNPNPGLRALIKSSNSSKELNSISVGFMLAPKINAAGRMGNVDIAVKLLTEDNEDACRKLAEELDSENKKRQQLEREIYSDAVTLIENDESFKTKKVIVAASENWHHGVIGIVASRISEKYSKPTLLLCIDENGVASGSGRSTKDFDLLKSLCNCCDLFTKFGGHEYAAGVTLDKDNLPKLDKALNDYADTVSEEICSVQSITIDFDVSEQYLTVDAVNALDMLEPFGPCNDRPCFAIKNARILSHRLMGENGRHVKFVVQKNNTCFDVVAFGKSELAENFIDGDIIDIAGNLSVNTWNNVSRIQVSYVDIKLSETASDDEADVVPDRNDMAVLYLYFKKHSQNGIFRDKTETLVRRASYETGVRYCRQKVTNCLNIFAELKLLSYVENGDNTEIYIIDTGGKKVDLESSKILSELRKSYN